MQHFLIGSRLFVKLFPDNPKIQKRLKDNTDYDVLVENEPTPEMIKYFKELYGQKTELHWIPILWRIFNYEDTFKSIETEGYSYLKDYLKDVYFTLKASHVSFDKVHKDKTFYDLFLMAEEGCVIIEPLFYELHDFWTKKFGEKWRADFTKESSEFFDDVVSRENVHDELHEAVKFYDVPAFKFLQEPDQTTVWVCPEKFKSTTEHIRQRVVIEEAQTLALERFILPKIINNKKIAYQKCLKGLVDRLAPLWMIIYIINNLNFFLNYEEDYGKTYLQGNF